MADGKPKQEAKHCYCDKCVEVVKSIVHKSLDKRGETNEEN